MGEGRVNAVLAWLAEPAPGVGVDLPGGKAIAVVCGALVVIAVLGAIIGRRR
jgi:hypothetical protein